MLIGLIGAPNKGKSTIFSALTLAEVEIADYPFTTIKPNLGVAYSTKECVEKELKVKCRPKNSFCINGIRHIPINIIDVAGLVPGAHIGKGMGSQFLNDLVAADVLIQVVDLSGETDINGSPVKNADPALEVNIVKEEITKWLSGIISKHMAALAKKPEGVEALKELLSGFNAKAEDIKNAIGTNNLTNSYINWDAEAVSRFSASFLKANKPIIIAANKLDKSDKGKLDALSAKFSGHVVIGCSGAIELALKRAAKSGAIDYISGSSDFMIKKEISTEQKEALVYMKKYLADNHTTGIQELINYAVFKFLDNIIAYPVEDEHKYTDHFGNVLPDAFLLRNGSTALDLAEKIHSDIAKNMLYAIDAKKKIRVSKEYVLRDQDVIKILSSSKH